MVKQSSRAVTGMPIPILTGILGLAAFAIFFSIGSENGINPFEIIKVSLVAIVLLTITIFYFLSQNKKIKELPYFDAVLIGIYIASYILILLLKGRMELPVWLAGGLLTAMLFDMYLGCLAAFQFIFIAAFIGNYSAETVIYLLIIGTLMCILSGYMKKIRMLGYTTVLILSIQIILLFILNNFIIKDSLDNNTLYSILSSLGSIGISYLGYQIYNRKTGSNKVTIRNTEDNPNISNSETNKAGTTGSAADRGAFSHNSGFNNIKNRKSETGTDFYQYLEESAAAEEEIFTESREFNSYSGNGNPTMEEILDLDFPLLQKLKQYSPKVYKHSLLIAELSAQAAKAAGADEFIAKAGGLYHEIGRIENKQYVEEGINLAKAYHLPGIVKDIIRQHNLKYEKPKSPEAAIVMITISIIATKEYLEKTEHQLNMQIDVAPVHIEKIVNNVFQMRLSKGSMDESGLTLRQYNLLKDFFLQMQI